MLDYKDALAELHLIKEKLAAEGHALAAKADEVYRALLDEAPKAEAEVKADAEQVAHDAVAAEAPVANEAMQDVAAVADTAVAGNTAATVQAVSESKSA